MDFDPAHIDTVIFDLGGVLYAIDPSRTERALQALAGPKAMALHPDAPLFHDFERGRYHPATFRDALRKALDSTATDAELDAAWNALLLGPIPGRVEWIRRLAQRYSVVLLSNTNTAHQLVWGPQCQPMFAYMEHTFFSFDLDLRKPEAAIYQHVLDAKGIEPRQALFFDDSPLNIRSAADLGMGTFLVNPQDDAAFLGFCSELLRKV